MICCYGGQQRLKKNLTQYTVGIEPSAVHAAVLNRCVPTDFIGCIPFTPHISVAKTETESQVCLRELSLPCRGDHSSVLLPVRQALLPFWWVKNIHVFSLRPATMKPYFYDPVQ